ncbi:MAG: GvpL/GvpF family gas vesicle protein [Planctomycetes bacterium]|nr:GvpL/GvpF family gas vesicle protein [Planctomycetota bacterium]MBI4222666.1 GvpL/GvpF family gas vesicle protein [Planctomycetota bacterium]
MYRYLYCITRKLHKPLMNVVGIGNANVHALQYEDIMAILSEVVMAKIPVSNGNALRHAAVIETVQKEQTVLPMRFSSVFHGDTAVLEFLKNRYATFVSDLERLRDTVEMGLRIVATSKNLQDTESMQSYRETVVREQVTEIPIPDFRSPMSSGTVYLQQRRAYYASQDENDEWVQEIVKTCHAQFEDICVKHKRDTHSSFSQGVSLHYLIHRDSLNEFKDRFNDLKSSLNELWFLCSGPWPPYHFVSPE